MDWQTLLAYMTGSVDDQLLLRNEYLVEENRILRDQIKGRVHLSDARRTTLTESAKSWVRKPWRRSLISLSLTRFWDGTAAGG